MRLLLALLAVTLAGPAMAQSSHCRSQALNVERQLNLAEPRLGTQERLMQGQWLDEAEDKCDTRPEQAEREMDRIRRDVETAETPRITNPDRGGGWGLDSDGWRRD